MSENHPAPRRLDVFAALAGGDPVCRRELADRYRVLKESAKDTMALHNGLVAIATRDQAALLDLILLYVPLFTKIAAQQVQVLERRNIDVSADEQIDLIRDLVVKFIEATYRARPATYPAFMAACLQHYFVDWLRRHRAVCPALPLFENIPYHEPPTSVDTGEYLSHRFPCLTVRQAEGLGYWIDGAPATGAADLMDISVRAYRALVARARGVIAEDVRRRGLYARVLGQSGSSRRSKTKIPQKVSPASLRLER